MKLSFFSRFGLGLVALAMVVSAPAVRAQNTTNRAALGIAFPTVTAGAQSNLLYQAAAGLNISPTAATLRNSPLGVDLLINASTTTNAVSVQSVYGFQLGFLDGTWANNCLLAVIPAGNSISNINFRTNFSQAVLGNATKIRHAITTNGNATSLVTSNITLNFFY